jgi:hypothetical protein
MLGLIFVCMDYAIFVCYLFVWTMTYVSVCMILLLLLIQMSQN